MRSEELAFISPRTRFSVSFIASLGYKVEKVSGGEWMEHWFKLISDVSENKIPQFVKRKNFFEFAAEKHKNLRIQEKVMLRNI